MGTIINPKLRQSSFNLKPRGFMTENDLKKFKLALEVLKLIIEIPLVTTALVVGIDKLLGL